MNPKHTITQRPSYQNTSHVANIKEEQAAGPLTRHLEISDKVERLLQKIGVLGEENVGLAKALDREVEKRSHLSQIYIQEITTYKSKQEEIQQSLAEVERRFAATKRAHADEIQAIRRAHEEKKERITQRKEAAHVEEIESLLKGISRLESKLEQAYNYIDRLEHLSSHPGQIAE